MYRCVVCFAVVRGTMTQIDEQQAETYNQALVGVHRAHPPAFRMRKGKRRCPNQRSQGGGQRKTRAQHLGMWGWRGCRDRIGRGRHRIAFSGPTVKLEIDLRIYRTRSKPADRVLLRRRLRLDFFKGRAAAGRRIVTLRRATTDPESGRFGQSADRYRPGRRSGYYFPYPESRISAMLAPSGVRWPQRLQSDSRWRTHLSKKEEALEVEGVVTQALAIRVFACN